MRATTHLRGIGYALASSLMFGLGVVLASMLGREIDAVIVGFLSLFTGGLLVALFLLLTGKPLFSSVLILKRRDWLALFLLACPGTALPLLLIVAGLARTSALVGGFLLQLNGVAALLFAVLLLGERIRLKQGLGTLLLLAGSVLVLLKSAQGGGGTSSLLGDGMVLAGAIGIGFSFIPAKRLSAHVDTLVLTALRLLLGACTLLPVFIFQLLANWHTLLWHPSPTTLLWVFPCYIVTNFCLGYLSQQEGFRLIKAWEVAALTQTVPLFSTLFAILLLRNNITPLQIAGGLVAVLGGIVVSLNGEAPVSAAPPVASDNAEQRTEASR